MEVVATEGAAPYKTAIDQYLPRAQHVPDRFPRHPLVRNVAPRAVPRPGNPACTAPAKTVSPPPNGNGSGNRLASPTATTPNLPGPQLGNLLPGPGPVHRPLPNGPNSPIPQNPLPPSSAGPTKSSSTPTHHRTTNQRTHRSRQQPPPKTQTHRPQPLQPPKLRPPRHPTNLIPNTNQTPPPSKTRRAKKI